MLLNCDLGESFGNWRMGMDADVMPFLDQANVACGFHAGDPIHMEKTLKLAAEHGVTVGAHPAYPDLVGFGRRTMALSADELRAVLSQLGIDARALLRKKESEYKELGLADAAAQETA